MNASQQHRSVERGRSTYALLPNGLSAGNSVRVSTANNDVRTLKITKE